MEWPGVSKTTNKSLELLEKFPWIRDFYLAGGTALAIQLEHRLSFDLDFFTPKSFDQKKIDFDLRLTGKYTLDRFAKNTLLGLFAKTKISFFTFKYPLISKTIHFRKIKLASIADIAAMKLEAIISRATKKDYVDLFFICRQYSIEDCIGFYQKKFSQSDSNIFYILKALNYFEDAESTDFPQMLHKISWEEIKKFFESESLRLAKKYL